MCTLIRSGERDIKKIKFHTKQFDKFIEICVHCTCSDGDMPRAVAERV